MTLNQKLKASAQELIRLLEESEKQHQQLIKDRDASVTILETKIIHLAGEISQLLKDQLDASIQAKREQESNSEYNEKTCYLWNRLLDFDAQIITAAFSSRPQSHLKLLAARLSNRY